MHFFTRAKLPLPGKTESMAVCWFYQSCSDFLTLIGSLKIGMQILIKFCMFDVQYSSNNADRKKNYRNYTFD